MFRVGKERDGKLRDYIRDAYILMFSGAAKYKVGGLGKGEVETELSEGIPVTIEFIDGSLDKIVERRYVESGELLYEWIYTRVGEDTYEAKFKWSGDRHRVG